MRKIKVRKQTADFHKPAVSIKAFAMSKRPPVYTYTFSGAKVYVFSRKTEYFPLKIVKSLGEDMNNKKEDYVL